VTGDGFDITGHALKVDNEKETGESAAVIIDENCP
jgi:hypothetical protein